MHIGDKGKEEWSSNAAIWRYSKICAGISSRIKIGVDLTRRPGADDNISGHTEHFTERRVIRKIKEKSSAGQGGVGRTCSRVAICQDQKK